MKKRVYNVIALVLICGMTLNSVMCNPLKAKADTGSKEYPFKLGDGNGDNTIYKWHLVKNDSQKMYEFLSDDYQKKLKDKTEKSFRVLLTFEGTVSVKRGKQYVYATSQYYYEANWTRVFFKDDSGYGVSSKPSFDNAQIRIGDDSFITRGSLRSFYCTYVDSDGVGSQYEDKHTYRFYFPYEDENGVEDAKASIDESSPNCRLLQYCEGDSWGDHGKLAVTAGRKNINKLYGSSECDWESVRKDHEDMQDQSSYYSRWSVSESGAKFFNQKGMNLSATDTKWGDGQLIHTIPFPNLDSNKGKGLFPNSLYTYNTKASNENRELNWLIYVGEPIYELKDVNWNSHLTNNYEIKDIAWIKRDQTYVIEEGGVLFVDAPLFLNGTIENHGIIFVQKGGCITSLDPGSAPSMIDNRGGDLLVEKDALVNISILKTWNGGQVINDAKHFYTRNMFSGDCVLQGMSSENVGKQIAEYRFIDYKKGAPKSTGDGNEPDKLAYVPQDKYTICRWNYGEDERKRFAGDDVSTYTWVLNAYTTMAKKHGLSDTGFDLRYKGTLMVNDKKEAKPSVVIDKAFPKDGLDWNAIVAAVQNTK